MLDDVCGLQTHMGMQEDGSWLTKDFLFTANQLTHTGWLFFVGTGNRRPSDSLLYQILSRKEISYRRYF